MPRRAFATQEQAARHISVSPRTIRSWISEGWITGYRLPGGRAVRVDLDKLDTMIKTIPASARAPKQPFGPKARIKDLRNVVMPVEPVEQEAER